VLEDRDVLDRQRIAGERARRIKGISAPRSLDLEDEPQDTVCVLYCPRNTPSKALLGRYCNTNAPSSHRTKRDFFMASLTGYDSW
jgi:hypothetical protein